MSFAMDANWVIFAICILAGNNSSDENNTAAVTLISTFLGFAFNLPASLLFTLIPLVTSMIGELREYEAKPASEQDPHELIKKRLRIAALNRSGLMIGTCAAIPAALFLVFSSDLATTVFGQNEDVAKIVQRPLQIGAIAGFFYVTKTVSEHLLTAFGKSKEMMYIMLPSFAAGTSIAYWLRDGGLGVPALGLSGIVIGYAIHMAVTTLGFGLCLRFARECQEFKFFDNIFNPNKNAIQGVTSSMLKLGLPVFLSLIPELALPLIVGIIAGIIGPEAQASMSLVMQFVFFTMNFSIAFGLTCMSEVGQRIGNKDYENVRRITWGGLATTLSYITLMCAVVSAYPDLLRETFGNPESGTAYPTLTRIMSIGIIGECSRLLILMLLRAAADVWAPTAILMLSAIAGSTIAGLLGLLTDLGV